MVPPPGVGGRGNVFELVQFHVHAGSEHTLDGHQYGAELHMVHKLRGGGGEEEDSDRRAVVAVFIEATASEDNSLFSNILAAFDGAADEVALDCNASLPNHYWGPSNGRDANAAAGSVLRLYDLIPHGSSFYRYDGGLTTPPCTEIVDWSVADRPIRISSLQYIDLTTLILAYRSKDTCEYATIASPSGSTSRPVQNLNGRTVSRICPAGPDYRTNNNSAVVFALAAAWAATLLACIVLCRNAPIDGRAAASPPADLNAEGGWRQPASFRPFLSDPSGFAFDDAAAAAEGSLSRRHATRRAREQES
jgi:carbonic anhydrase